MRNRLGQRPFHMGLQCKFPCRGGSLCPPVHCAWMRAAMGGLRHNSQLRDFMLL